MIEAVDLKVAGLEPGHLSVSLSRPHLSFRVSGADPEWKLERAEFALTIDGKTVTKTLDVVESLKIPWVFDSLESFTSFDLEVRVFGRGHWSDWSQKVHYEVGPLSAADWKAKMIAASWSEKPASVRKPPIFRKEFVVSPDLVSARLYFTALGVAEVYVNGVKVGEDVLVPGFTNYKAHLNFYAYDITGLLREGANCLSVMTGDGWYRGRMGFDGGAWDNFGEEIGVFAELHLDQTGSRLVATDESWTVGVGAIQNSGLYEGEFYDAREEPVGWQKPGFHGGGFSPAKELAFDKTVLRRPEAKPVQVVERLDPVSIERTDSGYLVDFGQNFSGTLELDIPRTDPGRAIVLRHAEVLEDGELCTRPLRTALSKDTYISDGSEVTWSPRFTIHGFRYAEIFGWPGTLTGSQIRARVIHTPMDRLGYFECSNSLINKFHENVVWSTKSNFVSIPTDCPQRDERLGWTGDIQVFAPTALLLFDAAPTIRDWFEDVRYEQELANGYVPVFVPTLPKHEHFWYDQTRVSGWNDVVTLTPRALFEATGDIGDLEDNFSAGETWVQIMVDEADAELNWSKNLQLGDWLDPAAPPDDPTKAMTDPFLVANAYFAASARAIADSARDLGRPSKALDQRADAVRAAFRRSYCNDDGTMTSDTQTAYALALAFGLTPEEHRSVAGERLASLVRKSGGHISTGFAGTPRVLEALGETGHTNEAFSLLEQTSCPSFLYPITMGATTTWERWDSMLPDGRVNPGEMTSFNHYALGAAASWLYHSVAGLAPSEPGWRKIRFAPTPGGGLTFARASHKTPYGTASIRWDIEGSTINVSCVVPPGSEGELILGKVHRTLASGTNNFSFSLATTIK